MEVKKAATAIGMLALTAMLFAPAAFAGPINPNLTWAPNPIAQGSTTTATYGVATDSDCPGGKTFAGTLKVTEPDGISTASIVVPATACGTTNLSAIYPTAFTGTASTKECGVYEATWSGTTSALIGGFHPKFSVTNNFVVQCETVPEFGAPAMLVSAIGLMGVLLLVRRKAILSPTA